MYAIKQFYLKLFNAKTTMKDKTMMCDETKNECCNHADPPWAVSYTHLRSRCGSRAGRFYFIRENVENQSGEALLDLGQVGQLVIDLGVVKHAAELLRTHAVGVDVHHGTGVGVGGVVHAGFMVDGVADGHAEGDIGKMCIRDSYFADEIGGFAFHLVQA